MAILGILAITATAAVAGTALPQTVQTTSSCKIDITMPAWSQQTMTDQKISERLSDLECTMTYQGNGIRNIKLHMRLLCDWNEQHFVFLPFLTMQPKFIGRNFEDIYLIIMVTI